MLCSCNEFVWIVCDVCGSMLTARLGKLIEEKVGFVMIAFSVCP